MATVNNDLLSLSEAVFALNADNPSTVLPTLYQKPTNMVPEGTDSGYASQISTPESKHSFFRKQLRTYNKSIPKLTKERFSDLREQYAESLNNFTRSLPSCSSVLMTLQVLGEDEESAEPWVFVQCDKAVFKKVNSFFKQPVIKMDFEPSQPDDRSPRLRVLVCPLKPRYLAEDHGFSSELDFHDNEPILIFSESPIRETLCGTRITTTNSCQATIGGIIKVIDMEMREKFFGMSAGHFVLRDYEDEPSQDSDDESYEEVFEFDLGSVDANIEEEHQSIHFTSGRLLGSTSLADVSNPSLNGGKNLDWSLISIEKQTHTFLPNVYLDKFISEDTHHASEFAETDVIILLAREQIRGTMSSAPSYLMVPPGNVLVQTYLLSCTDGTVLRPGTSGAWVVDANSSRLYGHVVASDIFNRVYVIPISDSFKNIRGHLSAVAVTVFTAPRNLAENSCPDSGYSSMLTTPDTSPNPQYNIYRNHPESIDSRDYRYSIPEPPPRASEREFRQLRRVQSE
ncbi:hypothetical protein BOTCAL_0123g00160 [Botryotinia calthae]|uniref:Uncharacterized protein n=1 Tax=Botryotinia calthae TaxID=38488 RepID=A0A4Y8D6N7_9HELO|nr:hypothetical protein BOTCAL_0123g00160 [Botryotinia calthae]